MTHLRLMVVDMPFGSYEEGAEQAFRNAARLMAETGCAAVKIEGGESMAGTVRFLTARDVPVMAHVGLTPQAVNIFGGYKVQGRGDDAERIRRDAVAVAEAGAFSVVLEKVPEALARSIDRKQKLISLYGISWRSIRKLWNNCSTPSPVSSGSG